LTKDVVAVCEITGNFENARCYYYNGLPKEMNLPKSNLNVTQDENTIKITTDNYARVVQLTGNAIYSDNYFDMLPNEIKTVTFEQYGAKTETNIICQNRA
jgi:beta-mannosidase